ncbi:hypothetical protein [Anaerotignum sp. MB30-C6]|uniref:hypothetical protein n=1 Tax=Anaerotignum sp. MB30-C6 TaxID=3070814 RepID=UPI0027DCF539|nr:hypothetical protein [Anaerotignum sp. MB30-C6]WMI81747.1 hypothetical protein RBQ60_03190 [Anaerotignum sp. MB30-C6]
MDLFQIISALKETFDGGYMVNDMILLDLMSFLDTNPFYKYLILFMVIFPLVKKFANYLVKIYMEHKDDHK